jgi:hypothetical protein
MGLQVLYPFVEAGKVEDQAEYALCIYKTRWQANIRISVVAVHGLNGDQTNTWTDRKTKAFWLKDFLLWRL